MNMMTVMITGKAWDLIVWNKSVFIHEQLKPYHLHMTLHHIIAIQLQYLWLVYIQVVRVCATSFVRLSRLPWMINWLLCNLSLSGKPQKWQNSLEATRTKKICMSTEHIIIIPLTDHQEKMDDASTIWFMTPWLDLLVALKHTYLFLSPSWTFDHSRVRKWCFQVPFPLPKNPLFTEFYLKCLV